MIAVRHIVNCQNGISSYEIASALGVTQKSAWFMLQRLREACDEFSFRLNEGNVARHTLQRLDSFAKAVAGRRLTYNNLTCGS